MIEDFNSQFAILNRSLFKQIIKYMERQQNGEQNDGKHCQRS